MDSTDRRPLGLSTDLADTDSPPPYEHSISEVVPKNSAVIPDSRDEKSSAVQAEEIASASTQGTQHLLTSPVSTISASEPLTIDISAARAPLTRNFSFSTTPTGEYADAFGAKEICPQEQPGLEVDHPGNFDKILFLPNEKQFSAKEEFVDTPIDSPANQDGETRDSPPREIRWLLLIVLIIVAAIGTALAIGLAVALKHRHEPPSRHSESLYEFGGDLNPAYFSTKGAFNGSGIALAQQSFDGDTQGTIVIYYQHFTGTIRSMQLRSGNWIGGTQADIVAYDAKNGTPISAVAYAVNGTSTWHLFYIDTENRIRQRSNSNQTNIWQAGSLNDLNIMALDSDAVGLQACWYGDFYGDSDYTGLNSPLVPNDENATSYASEVGMHLWFATDETTFQQYGWRGGEDVWEAQDTWHNMNGHAGVACYSWGPGTVTYTMMVNQDNTVEIWWKDTNTTLTSTPDHPIDVWVNSSVAINNAYATTSLGYTAFLYEQDATTAQLNGYNISFAAEHTKINTANNLVVDVQSTTADTPLMGTHFSITALNDASGGQNLLVFYQTIGNDITMLTRDIFGGPWTYNQLPVDVS